MAEMGVWEGPHGAAVRCQESAEMGEGEGLPRDAASCRKRAEKGVVEELLSFGAAFGPRSSRSRSKSQSIINSRTFPAAAIEI